MPWRRGSVSEKHDTAVSEVVLAFDDGSRATIVSRYQLIVELVEMTRAVLTMPEELRREIRRVWCDSKATACYSIDCAVTDPARLRRIGHAFADQLPGHNGIFLEARGCRGIELNPDWREPEF